MERLGQSVKGDTDNGAMVPPSYLPRVSQCGSTHTALTTPPFFVVVPIRFEERFLLHRKVLSDHFVIFFHFIVFCAYSFIKPVEQQPEG